jgi:uncharacterized protein (DUF1330 family)
MKKGYWFVAYRSVFDDAALKAYGALVPDIIDSFHGRILVRSAGPVQVFDEGIASRSVVIEFDSVETALAAHASEAYQHALKVLGNAVERDFRIVEGV